MMLKIPRLALSALETDVLEVAADPEGYGLDAEETAAYAALADAVRGQALHVPNNPADRDRVQCLLLELGNNLNEQAEAGHDPKFTRAASRTRAAGPNTSNTPRSSRPTSVELTAADLLASWE